MIQKKADHHGDHAPQEIPLGDGEHGVKTMNYMVFVNAFSPCPPCSPWLRAEIFG